ncbi:MAG: alkaline phosphatase family protein [Candidatus Omnitrophota bacterium]
MNRREFITSAGLLMTVPAFFSLLKSEGAPRSGLKADKVMVLGFDGMDPGIVMAMIKRGELPHMRQLIENGSFSRMISTAPPESPCAWASFTTGLDPAGHGIFGFLGRDPKTYAPFSTSAPVTHDSPKTFEIGEYKIPILGGEGVNYRKGKPFWDYIQEKEIDTTIFKIPANYPPSDMTHGRSIAGMGTPDIYGANGMFTLFTTDENESQKNFDGKGRAYYAYFNENDVFEEGVLDGPLNSLKKTPEETRLPFKVYWDRAHQTARIDIQGKEILLQEGGLSPWIELEFTMIPVLAHVKAMTRFYLLNANDKFRLYVYPLSITPSDPAQEISSPANYCEELAKHKGLFHTLGLPSDFNAIKTEVFSMENYITLSDSIFKESVNLFDYEYSRFFGLKRGMLFYYFSAIDQGSHIYWALRDPSHPYHRPEEAKRFGDQIEALYRKFDALLANVLKKLPRHVPLIVLSDHGFVPLRRTVNLNTLLHQHGFLKTVSEPDYSDSTPLTSGSVNLGETRAYGLGLNGLYLNLKGRESSGIVKPEDKRRVMNDIKNMLLSFKDPQTGVNPIGDVCICEDHYRGAHLKEGPDMIIGCNYSYGLDYAGAMGGIGREAVSDNLNRWSGDHIIAPMQVPAVLMTNFKMPVKQIPMIWDLAPTILNLFGIATPREMRGKSLI